MFVFLFLTYFTDVTLGSSNSKRKKMMLRKPKKAWFQLQLIEHLLRAWHHLWCLYQAMYQSEAVSPLIGDLQGQNNVHYNTKIVIFLSQCIDICTE